jgi:ribosomal protein S26
MAGADLRLSFLTTLRRKKGRDKFLQLRSLLVRRLRPSAKAILRLRMRHNILTATTDKYQIFCEACLRWLNLVEWGEEFACPRCNSLYAIEFAVYTKIEEESE